MTLARHEAPLAEETREKKESDTAKETPPPLKAKMVWQANDGRTAASAKVDELLAAVSQLACEKYITDHVTADYKDPIYTPGIRRAKSASPVDLRQAERNRHLLSGRFFG